MSDLKAQPISVGKTTFRATYADGNPLWKVIKKEGRNYLCQVDKESEWSGTTKVFRPEEIRCSLDMSSAFETIQSEHEKFYASLKAGQTIHYHNGFDQWVRCTVVIVDKKPVLKPIALVGEWREFDLPKRMADGSVHWGYHADSVRKGETMTPNYTNLYEAGCKSRKGINPSILVPKSLAVPAMTHEEEKTAALWQKVAAIRIVCNAQTKDPQSILTEVAKLLK